MNDLSRRSLIGAGAAGTVALLAPGPASAAARGRKRPRKPARKPVSGTAASLYTRSRFATRRNATFTLAGPSSSTAMVLTRVSDLPSTTAGATGCFTLTFRCATAGPPQGSYTLRRAGFTPTTLFVVPSDASRRTYQAVVNRSG